MSDVDAAIRLAIYAEVAATGRVLSPVGLASRFELTPMVIGDALRRLAQQHDALVLLPDSPYVWMAEPFSAVPTDYPVLGADDRRWYGNCSWDALAVAALVDVDTSIDTRCPASGTPLRLRVSSGGLQTSPTVAHFAVAPRDWWRSIGFT